MNELSQKEILIPNQIQMQAHIINVSFGVMKRKKARPNLPNRIERPRTSSTVRRSAARHGLSLSHPLKAE